MEKYDIYLKVLQSVRELGSAWFRFLNEHPDGVIPGSWSYMSTSEYGEVEEAFNELADKSTRVPSFGVFIASLYLEIVKCRFNFPGAKLAPETISKMAEKILVTNLLRG